MRGRATATLEDAPPLTIDFIGGAVGHRLRFGGGRRQALPRAAGFTRGRTPTVIDATAGLGRDAFLLASLGADVTLIERSPAIHALLAESMARAASATPELAAIIARMTLIEGDSRERLAGLRAETILVDPMHPARRSSALVKQEMRTLRAIVGEDPDAGELMKAALAAAEQRVVLKWPLRAPPLEGLPPPSHQITGKTMRYDVFMVKETAAARAEES